MLFILINDNVLRLEFIAGCYREDIFVLLKKKKIKVSHVAFWFCLGQLRPSRELLEYYRKKIAEYDDEHNKVVNKVEKYKDTFEESVCTIFSFIFLIRKGIVSICMLSYC